MDSLKITSKFTALLLLNAAALGLTASDVSAIPRRTARSTSSAAIFVPPTDETHSSSRAGGSRSTAACQQDSAAAALTAIAPQNRVGLTAAAQPTMLVYIPETSAQQLYFSVKTAAGEGHYEAVLPITQTGSVTALSLPAESPLALGTTYTWGVGLLCSAGQTDLPWVAGRIQRVPPLVALPEAGVERAIALGQAGLWYDAVSELSRAADDPLSASTVLGHWRELLSWTGASAATAESILSATD